MEDRRVLMEESRTRSAIQVLPALGRRSQPPRRRWAAAAERARAGEGLGRPCRALQAEKMQRLEGQVAQLQARGPRQALRSAQRAAARA
jgi:hypothetical protein